MDEVSNKTLATLLVVAIVISLAGTFFAMRGVSQITNTITGAQASPAGTARVNISEVTSITLFVNDVDFGAGYRNATAVNLNTECNLTSNQTYSPPNCWENTSVYAPEPFVVENDGNNYVNVTINSTTVDVFLNGTVLGGTERYQWAASDSTSGLFPSAENGCNTTAFAQAGWVEFSNAHQLVCANMSPYASEDTFNVDINISVCAGILGEKSAQVTFTGVKSAQ